MTINLIEDNAVKATKEYFPYTLGLDTIRQALEHQVEIFFCVHVHFLNFLFYTNYFMNIDFHLNILLIFLFMI